LKVWYGVPNVELYTRQTSALGQIVGIDLWPQIKALTGMQISR
jgi:hypothetical protein